MGVGAALTVPSALSIINDVFRDPALSVAIAITPPRVRPVTTFRRELIVVRAGDGSGRVAAHIAQLPPVPGQPPRCNIAAAQAQPVVGRQRLRCVQRLGRPGPHPGPGRLFAVAEASRWGLVRALPPASEEEAHAGGPGWFVARIINRRALHRATGCSAEGRPPRRVAVAPGGSLAASVRSELPSAQSCSDQVTDRAVDGTLPGLEAQADRLVLSVRDRGETDGAEAGPRELEADDLGDLEIAADCDEHAALAKIQDAANAQRAPARPQACRQVVRVGGTRRATSEFSELADRRGGASRNL